MDAHYHHLHKKYETFEKRQRRREKERLQHERYKMKERVDLIRTMDSRRSVSIHFPVYGSLASPLTLSLMLLVNAASPP